MFGGKISKCRISILNPTAQAVVVANGNGIQLVSEYSYGRVARVV